MKGLVLIGSKTLRFFMGFPLCCNFPPLKMLFQKDLKQESSELVTGDFLPVCFRYH